GFRTQAGARASADLGTTGGRARGGFRSRVGAGVRVKLAREARQTADLLTANVPSAELRFGKDGIAASSNDVASIRNHFSSEGVTDLFVLCGGWGNNSDVRLLYTALERMLFEVAHQSRRLSAHTYGVLRIYWDSCRWPGPAPQAEAGS